jgi:two-component system response regulator YesN
MRSLVIVDDEEWVRKLLKKLIPWEELGLAFAGEAASGSAALELCAATRPAIVVTDIRMPGIDGVVLMREVREVSPDSLVVVVSGYDEFDYAREALRYGAVGYLLKPVEESELRDVLASAVATIEKRELSRNRYRTARAEVRRLRSVIIRDGAARDEGPEPPCRTLAERAKAVIRGDLTVQRTLASIAEELGVSERHLSATFKAETGIGLSRFSTAVRVERAKELLAEPSLKVVDIAAMLGYADPHYFSRVFKKEVGVSPESFRSEEG